MSIKQRTDTQRKHCKQIWRQHCTKESEYLKTTMPFSICQLTLDTWHVMNSTTWKIKTKTIFTIFSTNKQTTTTPTIDLHRHVPLETIDPWSCCFFSQKEGNLHHYPFIIIIPPLVNDESSPLSQNDDNSNKSHDDHEEQQHEFNDTTLAPELFSQYNSIINQSIIIIILPHIIIIITIQQQQ